MISVNKTLITSLAFMCMSVLVYAQEGKNGTPKEVRGSGRTVQEHKVLKSFNVLEIEYLHGNITVEVGGTTSSLEVELDDNLHPLLQVEENGNTLKLALRDAQGSPIWDNVNYGLAIGVVKQPCNVEAG
jgi:hypothetical protein